jgi:8-oxo-dGTP diphosphatase
VAVHAIVEKDESLLLVKRAPHLSEGGKWGLPGGFLDRDETLAEGALRELREETGWQGRVASLLRINSRPDRPHEDRQNIPINRVLSLDLAFDHMDSVRAYLDARRRSVATPVLI